MASVGVADCGLLGGVFGGAAVGGAAGSGCSVLIASNGVSGYPGTLTSFKDCSGSAIGGKGIASVGVGSSC